MSNRDWCFTSYKANFHQDLVTENNLIKYIVYQKEKCPDTGREHWQGYVQLKKTARMAAVKAILGDPAAHLEVKRGTRDEARAYCMKEESRIEGPFEWGSFRAEKGNEKKKRKLEIVEEIKSGKKVGELILSADLSNYNEIRWADRVAQEAQYMRKRDIQRVIVLFGPTGIGKTRLATLIAERMFGEYYLQNGAFLKWWPGYSGQKCVIIDEYSGEEQKQPNMEYLKRLLDRYPCAVENKGGHAWLATECWIITSQTQPDEWFPNSDIAHRDALWRRILEGRQSVTGDGLGVILSPRPVTSLDLLNLEAAFEVATVGGVFQCSKSEPLLPLTEPSTPESDPEAVPETP